MRRSVHDRVINFRASSALVEAANRQAEADGMSLAELLRANLRNYLHASSVPIGARRELETRDNDL